MKKILLSIIAFVSIFTLTGCGNKTAITEETFTKKAQELGFEIYDVSSQYSSYGYVKSATVAKSGSWQLEFYELDSKDKAKSMFETNKKNFESQKGSTNTSNSKTIGNYSTFTLNTNETYMHLCRIDTTFLYVKVPKENKDDAKKLIDAIGY